MLGVVFYLPELLQHFWRLEFWLCLIDAGTPFDFKYSTVVSPPKPLATSRLGFVN